MATGQNKLPEIQGGNSTQNVLNLIQSLTGTKTKQTTSGGTQTQQTQLSPDAVNALIQQMLESNQGLAAVSSGQRSAGLYNSSVNTQLTNDLLSRVAGQTALASAPTVTTRTPTTTTNQTPGILGNVNPLLAAVALPVIKGAAEKISNGGGDVLSSIFGGATDSVVFKGGSKNAAKSVYDIFGAQDTGGFLDSLPATSSVITDFGNVGSSLTSNLDQLDFGGIGSLGGFDNIGGIPGLNGLGVANTLYNIFSSDNKDEAIIGGGVRLGVSAALNAIPVVGPFLALASNFLGDSVICTHMYKVGYLSEELYTVESLYGASVHPRIYTGYRMWADKAVSYLQKSPKATKFFAPLVTKFAEQTAYELGFAPTGSLVGKVLKSIGEPVCYILSFFKKASVNNVCAI